MKKKLLISFSSGESSAYMAQKCKEEYMDEYEMIFAMANTGEEREESLIFADQCDKYFGLNLVWVECITNPIYRQGVKAKIVNFETASRNGEPFEAMIAKHGIPNQNFKHCSRELKAYTINAYCRSIRWKDYYTAIGYRLDEPDRWSGDMEAKKHIYPLVYEFPMTKPAINRFWRDMPFRLNLKGYEGNCKVCWKKSLRKLLTLAKIRPELFMNFKKWEEKYEFYIPVSREHNQNAKPPFRFFRGNLSVDQILEMSKLPFEEAPDDHTVYTEYQQTELIFNNEIFDLDVVNDRCGIESCEAFE